MYDRNPADPRITHGLNLAVRTVRQPAQLRVGSVRPPDRRASLPEAVTTAQQRLWITYGETDFTGDFDRVAPPAYRLRVAVRVAQLRDHRHRAGGAPVHGRRDRREDRRGRGRRHSVRAESLGLVAQRRLVSHGRTTFRDNALNPLPLGQWDTLGLIDEQFQLAFTPWHRRVVRRKRDRRGVRRGRLRPCERRRRLVDPLGPRRLSRESRRSFLHSGRQQGSFRAREHGDVRRVRPADRACRV